MSAYGGPLPEITAESRPFWDGCRRHELLVQRCRACGTFQHYPRGVCARCWGADLEWRPSAGRGTVYTFTVVHRSQAPGFKERLPYVLAYVELEEGVQVLTNLVGCAPGEVAIGMPVRVTFEDVTPEVSLPRFAPAGL
jgi:uncharacterized OB-fold protein